MKLCTSTAVALLGLGLMTQSVAAELVSTAPEGARVYFITPVVNDTLKGSFTVKFGLAGMGVAPAGTDKENTGHHHLLINTDVATLDLTQPLPATDQIRHFGGGQTETEVTLPAGTHTLQLLLGNYVHIPHLTPVMSEKITITVE